MKPIPYPQRYSLKSAHLDQNDIDQIVAIIKKRCERLEISDNENEYESLDELRSYRGDNISHLNLIGTPEPHVDLSYTIGSGFFLFSSNENDNAKIAFNEIREILEKRKSRFGELIQSIFFKLACVGVNCILLVIMTMALLTGTFILSLIHFILLIVAVGLLALTSPTAYNCASSVTLINRNNTSHFWQRNSDDIIKIIFGTFLGFLLTKFFE